ncbi:MAG TPA: LacI family DNA-binding transcriptional regulator [Sphingomonas sp.]|jgi:LacI family transcriptional regulator
MRVDATDGNPECPIMGVKSKRSTIVDVAKLAGVSTKTVSRVLNREPHVTTEVRERVDHAARQLNYQPNVLAQGLVRRRSFLIGLVYENPSPSYVVELQMGALDRLKDERYSLIVVPVRSVRENAGNIVGLLRAAALDGVILAPPASDHPDVLASLDAAGISFARIAPTRMLDQGPSVVLDDVAAARAVAEHVLSFGHRRIGIIKGDPTHPSSEARLIGYTQALAASGVELRLDWIEHGLYTFESGFRAAQRLLGGTGSARPTAILVQNDEMAVGTLMAARELGIPVPEALSIVGFDDSEISRVAWPRLTTVRQPVFDMARTAAGMLLETLEGGEPSVLESHDFELLIRDSVAVAPVD